MILLDTFLHALLALSTYLSLELPRALLGLEPLAIASGFGEGLVQALRTVVPPPDRVACYILAEHVGGCHWHTIGDGFELPLVSISQASPAFAVLARPAPALTERMFAHYLALNPDHVQRLRVKPSTSQPAPTATSPSSDPRPSSRVKPSGATTSLPMPTAAPVDTHQPRSPSPNSPLSSTSYFDFWARMLQQLFQLFKPLVWDITVMVALCSVMVVVFTALCVLDRWRGWGYFLSDYNAPTDPLREYLEHIGKEHPWIEDELAHRVLLAAKPNMLHLPLGDQVPALAPAPVAPDAPPAPAAPVLPGAGVPNHAGNAVALAAVVPEPVVVQAPADGPQDSLVAAEVQRILDHMPHLDSTVLRELESLVSLGFGIGASSSGTLAPLDRDVLAELPLAHLQQRGGIPEGLRRQLDEVGNQQSAPAVPGDENGAPEADPGHETATYTGKGKGKA
ncbi:hypothetical protein FB45DRAFT_1063117 [Roridomyces roridus]|uniref:Uncharacterized protein n=1 Tax=Roridomyces roridus TaxID=1738132 RepID=A0AAD7BE64_9AGAR|nr:hypothetical protein FB45DRAFT_1063117 [Roridomyces roridus]